MDRTRALFGLALVLCAPAGAQELIFADGFESGDLRGWDTTAPTITDLAPATGSWSTNLRPTVSATFVDAVGIDTATFVLSIDGVDRTAEATVDASGFSWTPGGDLNEGLFQVLVTILDIAGNPAVLGWTFGLDLGAPVVFVLEPTGTLIDETEPTIRISVWDAWAGVEASAVEVSLDTVDISASCTLSSGFVSCVPPAPIAPGAHSLAVAVIDRAGHPASANGAFDLVVDGADPQLSISAPTEGALVTTPTVTVTGSVSDDVGVAKVAVNGHPAVIDAGTFSGNAGLVVGDNTLEVVVTDLAGRQQSATRTVRLDLSPPSVTVESPAPGTVTNTGSVVVTGTAEDREGLDSVEIDGAPVSLTEGRFETSLPLAFGTHEIEVRAVDLAGRETVVPRSVTRWSLPEVMIGTPADLATLAATHTDVTGTTTPGSTVVVNGVAASVAGGSFEAFGVPLIEGGNLITAVATDASGHQITDTITVVRDLEAPRLAIYRPRDGEVVHGSTIAVTGLVNDLVAGTVNASEATVTVAGAPAVVSNRSFAATVTLSPGWNTIEVEAVDEGGNLASAEVTVAYELPTGLAHLEVVSGDGQSAAIAAALPLPLVVRAHDEAGDPVEGLVVVFSVVQGNGTFPGGARRIAATTDGAGLASASLTLGTRAGVGNHVVEVEAPGFGYAAFVASAVPGPPAALLADAGIEQTGIAGRPLPRPLVATVTDLGHNRLGGVPVLFEVVKGAGLFPATGLGTAVIETDSDGRAIVEVSLDPEEGPASTVVRATIPELEPSPFATFVGSGLAAGDPADTAIGGVVLDGTGLPVEGVTARVRGTSLSATTDEAGLFRLHPAPVGTAYLDIDGSTANRPGTWPDLEYVVTTVPGREVDVGTPIHLLPLELGSGVFVDESTGGSIELPEIPGFRLDIAPGSVTFPGGGRSGLVSATAVHHDRIPMTPNFGQQPRLILTIQPAGARFDPPARLTLPNVENLTPGEVTEMYSFDHDLGHFVSIGPASVSRDGLVIVADEGVGIVKAGWHCGGSPAPGGAPNDCPSCMICNGSQCVPGCPTGFGTEGACSSECPRCFFNCGCAPGGDPGGTEVTISEVRGACAVPFEVESLFSVTTNAPGAVNWGHVPAEEQPPQAVGSEYLASFPEADQRYQFYMGRVMAYCSLGKLRKKDVWVGRPCSELPPTVLIENNAGHVDPLMKASEADFEPNLVVEQLAECVAGSGVSARVCTKILSLKYSPNLDYHPGGTALSGADDPQITESNCPEVFLNLLPVWAPPDPKVEVNLCVPLQGTYALTPALEAHEMTHEQNYRQFVVEPVLAFARTGEDGTGLFGCACERDPAVFFNTADKVDREKSRLVDPVRNPDECRAWAAGIAVAEAELRDLVSRAADAGWNCPGHPLPVAWDVERQGQQYTCTWPSATPQPACPELPQ